MKSYKNSYIINEERDSFSILQSEIGPYLRKVKAEIPELVVKAITKLEELGITSKKEVEHIKSLGKRDLERYAQEKGWSVVTTVDIWYLLKSITLTQLKMLPMFQTSTEREAILKGKLSVVDATLDLQTPAGRNAAAKVYMPLVIKVVNQFVGKSKLTRNELMSAALMAMTETMEKWDPKKGAKFKTVLAYNVRFAIQSEITKVGNNLSGVHQHSSKVLDKEGKGGSTTAASLDELVSKFDDGEGRMDYLGALATAGDDWETKKEEILDKGMGELYKIIDQIFSQRDAEIIYQYFGVNGRKQKSGAEIAREYGISSSLIHNKLIRKLFDKIQKAKGGHDILMALRDAYMESKCVPLVGRKKSYIMERLNGDPLLNCLNEETYYLDPAIVRNIHEGIVRFLTTSNQAIIEAVMENYSEDLILDNSELFEYYLEVMEGRSLYNISQVELLEKITKVREILNKN